jgi:DNA excision repair protein ERCC-2
MSQKTPAIKPSIDNAPIDKAPVDKAPVDKDLIDKRPSEKRIKLSVGDLVDFSARRGDLFSESGYAGPTSLEGIRGHQKVQKARNDSWQKEVSVKQAINQHGYIVTMTGRIDLLSADDQLIVIEEIKTTYRHPSQIAPSQQSLHLAQAKVYAYLYWRQLPTEQQKQHHAIEVIVNYFNVLDNISNPQSQRIQIDDLTDYFQQLLGRYIQWYSKVERHRQQVIQSSKALLFPFSDYRVGQHNFARQVYRAIREKQTLMVEAPTGTGKTMSTLFPAVKALGESLVKQIVYLTAKGSAQQNALVAAQTLVEQNLKLDYVVIQAKDKSCPCRSEEQIVRNSCVSSDGRCSRTIDFYDRLPDARIACLKTRHLDVDTLQAIADQFHLCPFELSLQMVRWFTLVICDVNYVFDPMVQLATFEQDRSQRVLLLDELHNLSDRGRDMFSAQLSSGETQQIAKALDGFPLVKKAANSLARMIKKLSEESILEEPPASVFNQVEKCLTAINQQESGAEGLNSGLANDVFGKQPEGYAQWVKALYRYYMIHQLFSESHRGFVLKHQFGRVQSTSINLRCLDCATLIGRQINLMRSMIGFSATISPVAFFSTLLGLDENARSLKLPPVFPVENQLTIHCDYIDTRWQARVGSVEPLIGLIEQVMLSRPGKYLIFFPSYEYMNSVCEPFIQNHSNFKVISQNAASTDQQRQAFLNAFFAEDDPIIGFAILGGVFGEGVDFKGDALHGTIIVGTGMPSPSAEQKALQNYYQQQGFNGFQYAFQFPGLTRVLQTAGRVIRSEQDRGVVILVDPRFSRNDYRGLFPAHWEMKRHSNINEISSSLTSFWSAAKE